MNSRGPDPLVPRSLRARDHLRTAVSMGASVAALFVAWRGRGDAALVFTALGVAVVCGGQVLATSRARRCRERDEATRRVELLALGADGGVWECDPVAATDWCSPGFRERLGLDPTGLHRGLSWFAERVHPDDRETWDRAVEGQCQPGVSYNLELRMRSDDGAYRWYRLRGQATRDADGRTVRHCGSIADVTEHHFAAARLRESESSFRSLSAASPVGILKSDAGGQCSYVNERWQQIAGLSEFEALGDGWLAAVEPADRERVAGLWRTFTGTGGTFDHEFRLRIPDGRERWVRSRSNAVHDRHGAVTGFVATIEDVTESRSAARALAEAHDRALQAARAKSEFLANMSHEIRTPLNGVIGMAELLQATPLADEQMDFVRTINTSADALLNIINDILDFSKIEAGKMTIECVPLDLRGLAEDVGEMLALKARERGLELVLAIEPTLPRRLMGDPTRIRQILLNLTTNAIKFTECGDVVVAASCLARDGDECAIRLSVRDSGIGIPEDRLGAVFESFTQADGSTTRKYGGTGLGLSICRQLAEIMGGSIHVTSAAGVGSEFWVELPMRASPDESERFEVTCDLSDTHVLVVDDHPTNRRILMEVVRGWGARPECAAGGEEALATLRREGGDPFSVVLLDYRMPGMNGIETAAKIREMAGPRRAIVVLSSSGSVGIETAAAPGVVDLWLTKPVREAALHRTFCTLLGPAAATPGTGAPVSEAAEAERFAALRLLLVEDNEVNRKVALRMLEQLGVHADVAVDGAQAIARLDRAEYDVVFMDCQMPVMDGFEATREIRRREAATGAHLRIVAMTANAMEGDRERCLESGMDDYVAKPVKLERIAEQLRIARTLTHREAA